MDILFVIILVMAFSRFLGQAGPPHTNRRTGGEIKLERPVVIKQAGCFSSGLFPPPVSSTAIHHHHHHPNTAPSKPTMFHQPRCLPI
jgi:hypothetical protein